MGGDAPLEAERGRIRDAAFALAVERGWGGATQEAVIDRAELEPGAFERHYRDVEECLLEVYDEAAREMMSRVSAAVADAPGWLEQMRALGLAMIEFLVEDEDRTRFFLIEVSYGGDRIRVARERDLRRICEMIDRGRLELDDPESIGSDTAVAVAGAIFLRIRQEVASGHFERAYEISPELMHTLVLPYLGEEVALAELHGPPPKPPRPHPGGEEAA